MKRIVSAVAMLVVVFIAGLAQAATLDWARNGEADMKDYQVYGCFTANCVLLKTQANFLGTVLQTAAGIRPSFVVDITNKEGSLGVVARDQSLNESGLSVPVPFDRVAPSIPADVKLTE